MQEWIKDRIIEAGQLAIAHRQDGLRISTKTDGTPVTSADLAVDTFLYDAIRTECPDDGILTEERPDPSNRLDKRRVWIVDPIDGTSSYLAGTDLWGILLACCEDGVPALAAAHFPELGLTLLAEAGGSCDLNGRTVRVSQTPIERSRVTCLGNGFKDIWPRQHPGRFPALELVRLAAGEFEGVVIRAGNNCGEHDYAWAGCAIEAAGGVITDETGASLRFNRPNRAMPPFIVASNGRIHEALLQALAAALPRSTTSSP